MTTNNLVHSRSIYISLPLFMNVSVKFSLILKAFVCSGEGEAVGNRRNYLLCSISSLTCLSFHFCTHMVKFEREHVYHFPCCSVFLVCNLLLVTLKWRYNIGITLSKLLFLPLFNCHQNAPDIILRSRRFSESVAFIDCLVSVAGCCWDSADLIKNDIMTTSMKI